MQSTFSVSTPPISDNKETKMTGIVNDNSKTRFNFILLANKKEFGKLCKTEMQEVVEGFYILPSFTIKSG